MSFIAVPIFIDAVADVPRALDRAEHAIKNGARLIEWRVDRLVSPPGGHDAVLRLAAESPAPCIITARSSLEGGLFDGDEADRVHLLRRLAEADHPPRYIDVELMAFQSDETLAQAALDLRTRDVGLILSLHDFAGRPADLLQRVEAMTRTEGCDVIKIVWQARSLRDNLELLELLAHRQKPMIALGMGYFGLMSRVLTPKGGGLLTFAADAPEGGTAPGQPTISELNDLYRFENVSRTTAVYGVIGWPVEHSRGPHIHNAAFEATDVDAVYLPLPVPESYESFKATLAAMLGDERLTFRGASVTLPHKLHLVRFVREMGGTVDRLADVAGAANTLVVGSDGSLTALNTDVAGAVAAIRGAGVDDLRGRRIAILGAGGVARAVAVGCGLEGAEITIVNRTEATAAALASELSGAMTIEARSAADLPSERFDVYVNATPLGMTGGPDPDGSALPDEVLLDHDSTVFDTVYTPERTPVLRRASAAGARCITGRTMFLEQAALQFEAWTGRPAPREVMNRGMTP